MENDDRGPDTPQPMDPEEREELVVDRRRLLKRAGLTAAAATVPATVLASPAFGGVESALRADASFIKSHPNWRFVFVSG